MVQNGTLNMKKGFEMRKKLLFSLISVLFFMGCQEGGQIPSNGGAALANEVTVLKSVVAKDLKNLGAWIKLGNIYMDTGKNEEAIDAYSHALELDPANVDVRTDRATCYRYTGKPEKAVEEYKTALTINPNHANAMKNLGVVLEYDLKRKKEAKQVFEELLKRHPDDPDSRKIKAEIERLGWAR